VRGRSTSMLRAAASRLVPSILTSAPSLDVGEREALLHRGQRSITRVDHTFEDRANLGFMVPA